MAAIALGGTVTEFSFLPGPQHLGHVRWQAPPNAPPWMGDLVSVAPYVMWSLLAAATIVFARLRPRVNRWLAAAIFFWCYFIPIGDIAWNLYGGRGDLAVGGIDGLALQAIGTVAVIGAVIGGHGVQRRLFGERAVDVRGYLACAVVLGAASAAAAGIGLLAFRRTISSPRRRPSSSGAASWWCASCGSSCSCRSASRRRAAVGSATPC